MLYIVRHGRTAMNKAQVLQGRSDLPLDEEGREQARQTAARFAEEKIHFDKVYTSPLIRAVETAKIICGDIEPQVEERLIEMDYGPYEGMDLTAPAPEVLAFFMDFTHVPAPEGMEPLSEVVRRLGEFVEEIREEAASGNVLLSTHAIAMKGALEYLTPESKGSYWSKNIGNCAVYAAEAGEAGYGVPGEVW